METLRAALPYRQHFIGVGLDSTEVGYPPELFRDVFAAAAAEGLHRVVHAGEEAGPDYVWQALDVLGAERIDHGIRAMEDPGLIRRLRDDQVPLTVCPMSNVALRACGSLGEHVLPAMLAEGLKATVNSDDPAYFGGYIDDNFAAIRRRDGPRRAGTGHPGPQLIRRLLRSAGTARPVAGRAGARGGGRLTPGQRPAATRGLRPVTPAGAPGRRS